VRNTVNVDFASISYDLEELADTSDSVVKLKYVALVYEHPLVVGEFSANFCG
jgi:hypothetical protein